jgi:2,4-dienoyl-CoA reductase-like NADH-dependent reductase (Old Yellow Enzyme family)
MVTWHLDKPLNVGPFELPGRIYLPAHQPGLAEGGQVSDRYIAYQRQRARSGVAMQVTGATPVAPSVEWADICLWNIDDSIVPGYQRLAHAVREEGGRMIAQLAHPGPTEEAGPEVIGPSRDFAEVSQQVVVPATHEQIERVIRQYAAAARRCRDGELDGIEISAAHGLFIGSFISPLTNHRDDEFGGDFERRLELPKRILDAVRAEVGYDMMLGIRLGIDDLNPGGIVPEEGARVAQALESRVDYISVMVGNNNRYESRVKHWPPTPAPQGLFRDAARVVTQAVTKPVAAVGRILSLAVANDLIDAGDADLIGIVRAQIAEPKLIPLSKQGRTHDIRPCVGVNVCTNGLLARQPLACAVNADVGSSLEIESLTRIADMRAVVVGSGPAGLEAARRMAARGAMVTLFEATAELGGRLAQWSKAPSRREVFKYVAWQRRALQNLGVDIRLGTRASASAVTALYPDEVIVAIGAPDISVDVPQDGTVPVLTADHAFDANALALPSGSVVVYDIPGAIDAMLIAEYLRAQNLDVTLVTSRIHVGEGEGITSFYPMLRSIADAGVQIVERMRLIGVENGRVQFEGIFGERGLSIAADRLVTWSGGSPDLTLSKQLSAVGVPHTLIGDAVRPRRFVDATAEAKSATDHIRPLTAAVSA